MSSKFRQTLIGIGLSCITGCQMFAPFQSPVVITESNIEAYRYKLCREMADELYEPYSYPFEIDQVQLRLNYPGSAPSKPMTVKRYAFVSAEMDIIHFWGGAANDRVSFRLQELRSLECFGKPPPNGAKLNSRGYEQVLMEIRDLPYKQYATLHPITVNPKKIFRTIKLRDGTSNHLENEFERLRLYRDTKHINGLRYDVEPIQPENLSEILKNQTGYN